METVLSKLNKAQEAGLADYQLLSTKDLADLLGMKPSTIRFWRHKGEGPQYFMLGRTPRYRLTDVINWQEGHLVKVG